MQHCRGLGTAIVAWIGVTTGPALAHHSFAMFDRQKVVTVEGAVTDFEWTNPHVWIHISAPDATGKIVVWQVEADSPSGLSRRGWKRSSLKPGDKVRVTLRPLKDGTKGGALVDLFANGARVGLIAEGDGPFSSGPAAPQAR